MTKDLIKITVIENSIVNTIETYNGEYRNLMQLLSDKMYLYCFGECGGMGRCATCSVRIQDLKGDSVTKDRNEPSTLAKYGLNDYQDVRLSCQILISNDLDGSTITILNND